MPVPAPGRIEPLQPLPDGFAFSTIGSIVINRNPTAGRTAGNRQPAEVPVRRVPWVRPIIETDETLLADIGSALASGRVTNDGPYLRDFERQLAAYFGVADCVVVSSGTAALLLATAALGLRGAKVVLPSFTFIATLNALVHGGMTPVFCDIEPDTWTLSPVHLRRLLADDPTIRLVVPVNVFGVPPDVAAIRDCLRGTEAVLMLDNAHGLGSERAGRRCAPEPDVQTYSFHATKMLPAVEGGAVVAADAHLLAEIRRLRNHGIAADPLASSLGYNAKMSELHAAVALRSLRGLDAALRRRRQYARRLRRVLVEECAATFTVQRVPEAVESNFQNLGVLCRGSDGRDVPAIQAGLEREGIETRRYFWPPLHHLPAYRGRESLPATDAVGGTVLCLPLHSRMEPQVLEHIESALRRTARRCE
jgi:dTDP-4-amino-4,6-dideoxygalactose transaminase